ncbi:MAG: hypothetical protein QM479_05875 [Pseudomonadota bacterium]
MLDEKMLALDNTFEQVKNILNDYMLSQAGGVKENHIVDATLTISQIYNKLEDL